MHMIEIKAEDGRLTLSPVGRIDSNNAAAAEEEINAALASYPHESVVVDADRLDYISSAGLRDILRLRKAEPTLSIINASSEVYDIFEMTGFTEMIPVSKGYRKLSVEGCEVIGRGAKGTVYRWNPDTIVKVYNNPDSLPDIHRERDLARRAFVLGIPTAIPYDVVKADGKFGSVFELLNAKSFSKLIQEDPENFDKYVKEFSAMLHTIHGTIVREDDMPDVKPRILKWTDDVRGFLEDEKLDKIAAMIRAVPDTLNMLHFDYHTNNIMMQGDEAILIDMDTLGHGHPVFELANVYVTYVAFGLYDPAFVENFLGLSYETAQKFWGRFLGVYLGTQDKAELADAEKKIRLIGLLRLLRHFARRSDGSAESKTQIAIAVDGINAIIDEVDSLEIKLTE